MFTRLVAGTVATAAITLALTGCGSSSSPAPVTTSSPQATTSTFPLPQPSTTTGVKTLAQVCPAIDAVMAEDAKPDANPTATAASLNKIAAEVVPADQALILGLANAFTIIAQDPSSAANQQTLSSLASALGSACQGTTSSPSP